MLLVYTTQVNSSFRARWLANSEVISQVLFTSEQPKKNKMAFVAIFSKIKLLFRALVIQLECVVYTKTIIHLSVGENVGYLPPLRWIIVNVVITIIIIIIIIITIIMMMMIIIIISFIIIVIIFIIIIIIVIIIIIIIMMMMMMMMILVSQVVVHGRNFWRI